MENNNIKWFAAGAGMLIIMLLFSFTQTLNTAHNSKSLDDFLKVSMPRPIKEFILGFTLEGRQVIREVEAGMAINTIISKVPKKSTGSLTKALVDKGSKIKSYNNAIEAARKKSLINEQRRRQFQARVIEQAERYRQSLRIQTLSQNEYEQAENLWKNPKLQVETSPENQNKKEEVQKLTSAEWKSLILTQPNEANIQKLIKALTSGEIEQDTYLEISETLIKDNSQEKRRMGIWALTSVYNRYAFISSAHLVNETDATTQKTLNDYMYNYNRIQTLGILEEVLKSQDSVAAAAAAQSITKAIQNIKSASNTTQSSNERNSPRTGGIPQQVKQLTLTSYQRLIPTLKFVAENNLNNLSQWAQNLLSQLQTAATTA